MAKKGLDLEAIGGAINAGFGDRLLIGVLMGFLDHIDPYRCYEYIKDNISLLHWVSDDDWKKYSKWAKQVDLDDITKDRVVAKLSKYHPDHLDVILNTPGGLDWLDNQITNMKEKLKNT